MSTNRSAVKYSRPASIEMKTRRWPDNQITKSPAWCAVDLRDGNQALPNPMSPEQKMQYFQLLCEIGFKEIEIGFPAAAADDYNFARELIEGGHIPDDVVISVLTQARPDLIDRTFESLAGVKRAVVHFYVAASELHRSFVFGKTVDEQLEMVRRSTKQIREKAGQMAGSTIGLEFSPEEFTDTDLDYAVQLCDLVIETWEPEADEKVILNLPATVERRLPHEYADMIEAFIDRQAYADHSIVSLHAHNDMGMAVAATTQSVMAGADRIEGTLFGHGERTGNVDLVTCAMNMEYLGVDTGLDFSDLGKIVDTVEEVTGIPTHVRHPYAGQLVFTAFSGSHQDAIHKGIERRDELSEHFGGWKVPYLHVDPSRYGRSFERFIRINSQSGKGGIAHVMQEEYHIRMPRWVQVDFARKVQAFADEVQRELTGKELWTIFRYHYKKHGEPIDLQNYWPRPNQEDPDFIDGEVHLAYNGERHVLRDTGNGPISAFVHAVKQLEGIPDFNLEDYEEGTRGKGADAEGICFIRLTVPDTKESHIGVGLGSNIDQAAARATVAALNAFLRQED